MVRSVFLALLAYTLGLLPFYFLTPVHDSVHAILAPRPVATTAPVFVAPTPTPSLAQRQKNAGAEVVSPVDLTPQPTQAPAPTAPPTPMAGGSRFAFLLLGYGGADHQGGYLTDSIMVVIADPTHKTMTLLSLPRDSWVPLSFNGKTSVYNKINTAYAFAKDPSLFPDRLDQYTGDHGAGIFAMDTVSRLLGIKITYYATLDFAGFRDAINAVGGIDVDVPQGFALLYPANDDSSVNASWTTVRFQAGKQHMDGERAIEYARARETISGDTSPNDVNQGSDFARSQRQRQIIEAFKNRLLTPAGLIHLPQLLSIASKHVDTNYAVPAIAQLSQLALDWKDVKFYQTALTQQNYLEPGTGPAPENTYLLVPSSPDHSWAQIRAFTRRLWQDPATGVAIANTDLVVQNDTGIPGLAGNLSDQLMQLGYNVGPPVTGPVLDKTQFVDRTGGKAAPVAKQLEKDLGIDVQMQSGQSSAGAPDELVLELGKDQINLKLNVPPDESAPSSTYGVQDFGAWVPYTPPTPTPRPRPASVIKKSAVPVPRRAGTLRTARAPRHR